MTGTLVAVVAAGGAVVAVTSGDDGPGDAVAVDQPAGPASTLVLTRLDGSTYAFDDVTVSCDPPVTTAGDPMELATPGQIWAYSPIDFSGDVESDDMTLNRPFVLVQGTVAKLRTERTFQMPIDGPGDSSTYPLTLFVADTEGAPDGNEVASSTGGSGTVRVLEASCDPVPVLRLQVDATLGSEEGKESLDLAGELR